MDQLPIILISKQLKYILTTEKVKTLEKARQLLPRWNKDDLKWKKIATATQKYDQLQSKVSNVMEGRQNSVLEEKKQRKILQILQQENSQSNHKEDIFMKMMKQPKLIEIYGQKGTGKSSFALYMAAEYAQLYPKNTVTIFNCATGITNPRLQNLPNINYIDIFSSQQGINCCKKIIQKEQQALVNQEKARPQKYYRSRSLIVIDSITNFFLGEQKIKSSITNFFNILQQLKLRYGLTIIFTNYLYQKIVMNTKNDDEDDPLIDKNVHKFDSDISIYNHQSYFNFYHAEYIDYKIFVQKVRKDNFGETGFLVKGVKGKQFEGKFFIGGQGLQEIFISKVW